MQPDDNAEGVSLMPKVIPAVSVLGLLALCLAGSNWPAGKPAWAAGPQAQTPPRLQYPPLFFREDWSLPGVLPNSNTPQEPEHTVVQADVANSNLEVRLYGDKVGPVTVKQTYNNDI